VAEAAEFHKLEAVLADRTRVLGAGHPHPLDTRHECARWRGEAGDVAGAVTAFKAVAADRTRVLGADHPHTLVSRHEYARWQSELIRAKG
jgi:hypothetical protein